MAIRQTPSGSWQWDLKLAGWQRRERGTFRTQAEAEAHDHQTKAEHVLGRPYKAPTHTSSVATRAQTISDLVEHCYKVRWSEQRSNAKPGCTSHVHPCYRNGLLFADWCGPKLPAAEALAYQKVADYAIYRRDELRNSPQTIDHHLAAISVLLDVAVASGLLPGRYKLPKQPRKEIVHRHRWYTESEEQTILATCLKLGERDFHDPFVVLAETAFRPPREVSGLPWIDIAPTRITVHASIAKNKKERKLPCSKRAREALERVRARHPDSKGPFTWLTDNKLGNFWDRQRTLIEWLDKDTVPYTFRHTACTRWANARHGVTPAQIAHWAGHTVVMQQRYVHPVDERDDYAALVGVMAAAA